MNINYYQAIKDIFRLYEDAQKKCNRKTENRRPSLAPPVCYFLRGFSPQ